MPEFNPLRYPLALSEMRYFSGESAWSGHLPLALTIIPMTRPRTFVELGTHYGDSYCAFCQAVAELKLNTRCHAVDTWKGDAHTGAYVDTIYQRLKSFHDPAYGSFSMLLRMTFDEAAGKCPDNSIDLLHIDGLHTYAAVKHDYETWKPKLSERGVALFHDTAATHADFGVWKLWAELKDQHPSFDFPHENGLGILAVGKDAPAELLSFIEMAKREEKLVRDYFSGIGARWTLLALMMRMANTLNAAHMTVDRWRTQSGHPPAAPPQGMLGLVQAIRVDVQQLLQQR
ncbi:MAG: hypothetical protein QOF78_2465 [Phycisphaerales bacterium]|jgi:hypothetical protein|nr:hypothetical protein [Phycisphaerales bacterium]